jgi:hypothetical protein
MKVEGLILLIIIKILLLWAIWYRISNNILKKKYYKNTYGKGKNDGETSRGEGLPGETDNLAPRPSESSKRSILETTSVDSFGKNSNIFRRIFKKIKRK